MTDIIEKLGFLSGGSRFRRIYEKLQISGDRIYKDSGLGFKSSWFPVYYVLSRTEEPQTIMEITNQITFSHITVKNIVKELEKEGLVHVSANPEDKRSKLVSLTPKGLKLLDKLNPVWEQISGALREILVAGHPEIIAILERIDNELERNPLHERVSTR
ncbi:winged helix DNA-binding protein [Fulvivirga sp. 29W222]|uniref:Winged helix DNA-binding protein n=1 Tax=Fulvivirga marina TaxID=2494733 RepID=A0A937KCA2_9BACT|nr:winged helix DNA-binding protein [Fulvivirga marina]MBL6447946.1 winged helix DNA-binding protein [Fulvivirga marina]